MPGVEPGSVLGPVANLFQPKQERFLTALENTAGSRLFQVVVRDDAVAAQIVSHFRSQRTGRVTLLRWSRCEEWWRSRGFPKTHGAIRC